jgi:hypothetical protein
MLDQSHFEQLGCFAKTAVAKTGLNAFSIENIALYMLYDHGILELKFLGCEMQLQAFS